MHRPSLRIVAAGISLAALGLGGCAAGSRQAEGSPDRADDRDGAVRDNSGLYAHPPLLPPNEVRLATGAPGPKYWQQRVDYSIEAALDAETKTVSGSASVVYYNNSPDALDHLWINLEQNLFKKTSQGAMLTRPSARFGNRDWFDGGIKVSEVMWQGATPLKLEVYDTIGRITLPEPIAPGTTYVFTVKWSFAIPTYGSDRMGIAENKDGPVFEIAQWFPQVCVYDDVRGWNTEPYLGQGEFYTNFGSYNVSLTVPRSHIVAATGVLMNPQDVLTTQQMERLSSARASEKTVAIIMPEEAGAAAARPQGQFIPPTMTWRFHADNVRTFAWASSPAFIWDACTAPGVGIGSDADVGRGEGTLCQSFYPREAATWLPSAPGGGATQDLRASIDHYSKRWYAYPYPTASNINGVAGGMEYPMIVFCGGRDNEHDLWGVTTHEIGHTWFPMIVNTNERVHAWMDEGFNTFINYYANLERYPKDLPKRGNPRTFAHEHPRPMLQKIDTPADLIIRGTLGDLEYAKTSAGLTLLRETILGPDRFDAAFRTYIRRWAFRSPTPADFFRTMEDQSGENLGWFWRGWFDTTGVLDQSVTGVLQPEGESKNARVTFQTRGGLIMPLVYKVTYDDGTTETRTLPVQAWCDGDTWVATWSTGGRKIKSVVVDPNEAFPDVEPRNNSWPR